MNRRAKKQFVFSMVVGCALSTAFAGTASFRLEEVTTLPEVPRLGLSLFAQGSGQLSRFEFELSYPKADLRFVDATAHGEELRQASVVIGEVSGDPQFGTVPVSVELPEAVALSEEERELVDVIFRLGGGMEAGAALDIQFASSPLVVVSGEEKEAAATGGRIAIFDDNFLILEDGWGYPGQQGIQVELKAFNPDPLMGLQASCEFDPGALYLNRVSEENTMTELLGCEFFKANVDNENGTFVLGVLMDDSPPVDPSKRYPAMGYRLSVARLFFDVAGDAQPATDVPLVFADGHGNPPIDNRVVVDNESKVPQTVNGTFHIGRIPVFLRGDVNGDGRVDIADPVMICCYLFFDYSIGCVKAADVDDDGEVRINDPQFLLVYLFRSGEPVPPPFPEPGNDPTPDDLSCEEG